MLHILLKWLIYSGIIYFTCLIMPGIKIANFRVAIIVAVVLAIINTIVKPVLIFLTFPITIVTMGVFLLVINALMLMLASKMVKGFDINSFWSALFGSMIISFFYSFIYQYSEETAPVNNDTVVMVINSVRHFT
jgi:putative membrane protein